MAVDAALVVDKAHRSKVGGLGGREAVSGGVALLVIVGVILFFAMQKYFVESIAMTGLKS